MADLPPRDRRFTLGCLGPAMLARRHDQLIAQPDGQAAGWDFASAVPVRSAIRLRQRPPC
jgi:hypothetical protein